VRACVEPLRELNWSLSGKKLCPRQHEADHQADKGLRYVQKEYDA
jgi:hypothetical protein